MVTHSDNPPGTLKIVFAGSMGAGKTTAIRAISDGDTLSTEVPISDAPIGGKLSTTVGFDYGESRIDDGLTLRLFGTPGQERFRFMWDILGTGAFGLVLLADNSRPDPIGDVEHYLDAFLPHVPPRRLVGGVGRTDEHPSPSVDEFCDRLRRRALSLPVIEVDVRRPEDVRLLLSVLVSMAEVEHG